MIAVAQQGLWHTGHVFSTAVSSDGKYVASGGRDGCIRIWDPRIARQVEVLEGHRGSVYGLSFRDGSNDLFSAGHDRSVKIWNLDHMSFVDVLLR